MTNWSGWRTPWCGRILSLRKIHGGKVSTIMSGRVHVIAGGYPYARLRLLGLLAEQGLLATVGNDFSDIHRWLPGTQMLITYVAGPYLDDDQNQIVRRWLDDGGHWL